MLWDDDKNILVGKTVTKFFVSKGDKSTWKLALDDGSFVNISVEGDCCSSSWVEHVSGVSGYKPSKIVDYAHNSMEITEEFNKNKPEGAYDEECLQQYQESFILENGTRVDFEHRNSSNGYYGGTMNFSPGEAPDMRAWTEVTEDR